MPETLHELTVRWQTLFFLVVYVVGLGLVLTNEMLLPEGYFQDHDYILELVEAPVILIGGSYGATAAVYKAILGSGAPRIVVGMINFTLVVSGLWLVCRTVGGGVQDNVLPPGIYPINGSEQQVDIVEIGYTETTIKSVQKRMSDGSLFLDDKGEPVIADSKTGIHFPSNDGFPIHMDFTAIWGIMPDQAPQVIRTFGNLNAVEEKVVLPQTESICRNKGSQYSAVELLVGVDRTKFQLETGKAFKAILDDKKITMLYGLVRHIYIPKEVRAPIQAKFIADEVRLTKDQEQLTAREEATFREAERGIQLEAEKVRSETRKLVATALAEGTKVVGETRAETIKFVAAVDKETAQQEAAATVVLGEANATAEKMQREAKAEKFKLAVQAFGTSESYNQWVFASGLPEDIRLQLLYAGDGTFWTDLKGFTPTVLGKQLDDARKQKQQK